MKRSSVYIHGAQLCAVTALYVGVRLWHLGDSCLWFDEMYTVQAAELAWNDILGFLALDLVHPPLFYLLLKVWMSIGGDGIVFVRLLSVVFACLAIAPLILFCRELRLGRWATLFVLVLLACNGSLIKYAQEVRMYTMLMFVTLCSFWLFARYINRGKGLIALVVVNVAAVYVHYYAFIIIATEVFAVLVLQRAKLKQIVVAAGIAFAAFLPWMIVVVGTARSGDLGENIDWIKRPEMKVLINFMLDFVEPFYVQTSSSEPTSIVSVSLPIIVLIVIVIVGYFTAANGSERKSDTIRLLFALTLMPIVIVFLASWLLPYSIWGTRHLTVVFAPATMLMVALGTELSSRTLRTILVTTLLLLTGYAGVLALRRDVTNYVWCGWEPLSREIISSRPADAPGIYVSENLAAYHIWFAHRHQPGFYVTIVKAPPGEFVDREYFPPRGFDGIRFARAEEINEKDIVLLYRREKPDFTEWLLQHLLERGYQPCPAREVNFGRSTLVRVRMTLNSLGCPGNE